MQAGAGEAGRQPAQIGLHAAMVLLILLLSVPFQLLLTHNFAQDGVPDKDGGDIEQIRLDGVTRLGKGIQDMVGRLSSTLDYYSSWGHLKELVLVPHKRRDRSSVHLKTTVIRSDKGTTTILLTKDSKRKDKQDGDLSEQPQKSVDNARRQNSKQSGQSKAKTSVPDTKQSSQEQTKTPKTKVVDEGTSPAKEVEDYLYREVYFTQSKALRTSKSSDIWFSVGQVVSHVTEGYYGVVIGWDPVAKAPESWIDTYYSQRRYVTSTPHYLVLVDSHFDASGTPYHYVPQEDLQIVHSNIQVQCPEVSKYFEGYKNGRHIPKPWLRARYPLD